MKSKTWAVPVDPQYIKKIKAYHKKPCQLIY